MLHNADLLELMNGNKKCFEEDLTAKPISNWARIVSNNRKRHRIARKAKTQKEF